MKPKRFFEKVNTYLGTEEEKALWSEMFDAFLHGKLEEVMEKELGKAEALAREISELKRSIEAKLKLLDDESK